MGNQKIKSTQIGQCIREVVKKEHPETVERLVRLVQQKHSLSEHEIMDIVCHTGLRFTKQPQLSSDLKHYMVNIDARWYWSIIALCMLAATFALVLPEINPVVYIRYLLGSVFVFCMPGYCLVKNLFFGKKIGGLETMALSWGTSTVLVPILAFVLHYTPWGITTASVIVVLLILTLALSTLAIFREHHNLSKR